MELLLLQSVKQSIVIDQATACGVHQHNVVLHHVDSLFIYQMICTTLTHDQRCVQGDEISLRDNFFQSAVGEQTFVNQGLIGISVPGDNGHAVALTDAGEALADLTGSEDTGNLVVEIETNQTGEAEVVVLHTVVSTMETAVCSLKNSHRMLCNCIRRICRNTKNGHAIFLGSHEVNIIEACATQKDQMYATFIESLDYLSIAFVIYENADRIVASCKRRRLFS